MPTKKPTRYINRKQAARGFHAVRFAGEMDRPMNLFITINLTRLGIDRLEAVKFFQNLWGRVSRWYSYQRNRDRPFGAFAAVAVHECPLGGPHHVHWVMHVPEDSSDSEILDVIYNRLRKLTGLAYVEGAVHLRDVPTPGSLAKYLMKGMDPNHAANYFVRFVDQGLVFGRRTTVSRAIGPAARKREGWVQKKSSRYVRRCTSAPKETVAANRRPALGMRSRKSDVTGKATPDGAAAAIYANLTASHLAPGDDVLKVAVRNGIAPRTLPP